MTLVSYTTSQGSSFRLGEVGEVVVPISQVAVRRKITLGLWEEACEQQPLETALPLEVAMVTVKCMDSGAWLPRLKSQLHHSQAASPCMC